MGSEDDRDCWTIERAEARFRSWLRHNPWFYEAHGDPEDEADVELDEPYDMEAHEAGLPVDALGDVLEGDELADYLADGEGSRMSECGW